MGVGIGALINKCGKFDYNVVKITLVIDLFTSLLWIGILFRHTHCVDNLYNCSGLEDFVSTVSLDSCPRIGLRVLYGLRNVG